MTTITPTKPKSPRVTARHRNIGRVAADRLLTNVRYSWFTPNVEFLWTDPGPRTWTDMIADAYAAYAAGAKDRMITLASSSTTPKDTAFHVLWNLDEFLGHDIVWDVLDEVLEDS